MYWDHWYLLKLDKDQSVHLVAETLQRRFDEILFARLLENNALTQIFNAEAIIKLVNSGVWGIEIRMYNNPNSIVDKTAA